MKSKLDPRTRRILRVVEHRADESQQVLARDAGCHVSLLTRKLEYLATSGIIVGPAYVVDTSRVGLWNVTIHCSLQLPGRDSLRALTTLTARNPAIEWLALISGDHQVAVGFLGRTLDESLAHADELFSTEGVKLLNKTVLIRRRFLSFGRKYLDPSVPGSNRVRVGVHADAVELDQLDQKILKLLIHDGRLTQHDIAQRLSTPATTVSFRITRLKQRGVVPAKVYRLSTENLGVLQFRCQLFLRVLSGQLFDEIYAFVHNHPNIIYLFEYVGEWEVELGVEVYNGSEMHGITAAIEARFAHVLMRVRVIQVFKSLRYTPYPEHFSENKR